jgi:Tol biopolymer transport system component
VDPDRVPALHGRAAGRGQTARRVAGAAADAVAGAGEFAPDGKRLVYSPLFRDFRTWKRYQGGWAPDLFVFDPATGAAENITNHVRTDRDPMWIGNRIWFASDRTGTLNLWSCDLQDKSLRQETQSTTWDVRWPSSGGPHDDRIVYEKAASSAGSTARRARSTRSRSRCPTKACWCARRASTRAASSRVMR